jgi:hypothetical protein
MRNRSLNRVKVQVSAAVGSLAVVGMLALSSVASLALTSNAAATGSSQVTCAKLTATEAGGLQSKCTGPSNLFGTEKVGKGKMISASTSAPAGYQHGSIATWGPGGSGGTTTQGLNGTLTSGGACGSAKKWGTEVMTGKVVSGTGNATELVGDTVSATLCYNLTTGKVKFLKGTVEDL